MPKDCSWLSFPALNLHLIYYVWCFISGIIFFNYLFANWWERCALKGRERERARERVKEKESFHQLFPSLNAHHCRGWPTLRLEAVDSVWISKMGGRNSITDEPLWLPPRICTCQKLQSEAEEGVDPVLKWNVGLLSTRTNAHLYNSYFFLWKIC